MRKLFITLFAMLCLSVSVPLMAQPPAIGQLPDIAQPSASHNLDQPVKSTSHGLVSGFDLDFLNDQKDIWTSPLHVNGGDLKWLVPIGAAGTLYIFDEKVEAAVDSEVVMQVLKFAVSRERPNLANSFMEDRTAPGLTFLIVFALSLFAGGIFLVARSVIDLVRNRKSSKPSSAGA